MCDFVPGISHLSSTVFFRKLKDGGIDAQHRSGCKRNSVESKTGKMFERNEHH